MLLCLARQVNHNILAFFETIQLLDDCCIKIVYRVILFLVVIILEHLIAKTSNP